MYTIDTTDDGDHKMSVIPIASSDDEYDLREHAPDGDLGSEDGETEVEKAPQRSSRSARILSPNFYKQAVRRQNCFFGISLVHIVAAFVAAYFLMGMSFTRSNIAIFGDEATMGGSSGEVGIDADNAEVQEIIDEEIAELEEAGDWGENANRIDANQRFKDLIKNRDKVGLNNWTEKKQWWLENKDHLDESKMTAKEKKIVNRIKQEEERQKEIEKKKKKAREEAREKRKNNKGRGKGQSDTHDAAAADATDLDLITEKMSKHYNFPHAQPGRPGNKMKGHDGRNKENRPGNGRQKENRPGNGRQKENRPGKPSKQKQASNNQQRAKSSKGGTNSDDN